jgi:glycine/D-amino acid oxidase-like deaminating enzyme
MPFPRSPPATMDGMARADGYRSLSFWHDTVPGNLTPGEPLPGDIEVDVAIVGGGLTGLWTAYYLHKADPALRIVICEREIAGYGASGRNGGWCSALFPASLAKLERMSDRAGAIAMQRAMHETVDEVGRVAAAEGIDCHWAKGGTVMLARSPMQLQRAHEEVEEARAYGFGEEDLRLLSAAEATNSVAATSVQGGTYTPHCAAIHPSRLVRGLADVMRQQAGVSIFERTEVQEIHAGRVVTRLGTVRARYVIRATEGFTPTIAGFRRAVAPVYSLMIATEPLPDAVWDEIGLADRPTFGDLRHLIIYGQRTADGRFAFGGRGAPYHLGSSVRPSFDRVPAVFADLRRTLAELFPVLGDVRVTHSWGGPIGIARDWCASVGLDPETGIGWAGGYVGDGLSTTNLAGRTLADLITGTDSDLVRLPWVGHRSPEWEPEPLRWLGLNAGLKVMDMADRSEAKTGRPSRAAGFMDRFIGG